jgi:hypothetical protein
VIELVGTIVFAIAEVVVFVAIGDIVCVRGTVEDTIEVVVAIPVLTKSGVTFSHPNRVGKIKNTTVTKQIFNKFRILSPNEI